MPTEPVAILRSRFCVCSGKWLRSGSSTFLADAAATAVGLSVALVLCWRTPGPPLLFDRCRADWLGTPCSIAMRPLGDVLYALKCHSENSFWKSTISKLLIFSHTYCMGRIATVWSCWWAAFIPLALLLCISNEVLLLIKRGWWLTAPATSSFAWSDCCARVLLPGAPFTWPPTPTSPLRKPFP